MTVSSSESEYTRVMRSLINSNSTLEEVLVVLKRQKPTLTCIQAV
ncbi:hypothetical protein [Nostoc sp.]